MAAKHVLGDVCEVIRRSDVFHIDPRNIIVVDGWNERTDFSGEDEMVESIKECGVIDALFVRKTKDKTIELIDGERRLRASLRAIAEGSDIKSVPVTVAKRGTNEADLFAASLLSNTGKPFTPTEEAAGFRRLANWGWDTKTIAAKSGKSISHVRNRLELSEAAPPIKQAVEKKEITISQAQEIVKESDGKIDHQEKALEKAIEKKKAPVIKKTTLKLFVKEGKLKATGCNETCDPIENFITTSEFQNAVRESGFDPKSIKITIDRLEV